MIDVYTDASINKRCTKYAIGMFIVDEYERERSFNSDGSVSKLVECLDLEPKKEISISIIEAYSIYLALKYMNATNQKGVVYTDSLSSLDLIYDIVKGNSKTMRKVIQLCKKELEKNDNLEVRWIKAHSCIYGNEQADILAKSSMNGKLNYKNINWR